MSEEELDNRYDSLLEEQFILKYFGKLSIFEQENIVAEDRQWWYNRIKKQLEDEENASKKHQEV